MPKRVPRERRVNDGCGESFADWPVACGSVGANQQPRSPSETARGSIGGPVAAWHCAKNGWRVVLLNQSADRRDGCADLSCIGIRKSDARNGLDCAQRFGSMPRWWRYDVAKPEAKCFVFQFGTPFASFKEVQERRDVRRVQPIRGQPFRLHQLYGRWSFSAWCIRRVFDLQRLQTLLQWTSVTQPTHESAPRRKTLRLHPPWLLQEVLALLHPQGPHEHPPATQTLYLQGMRQGLPQRLQSQPTRSHSHQIQALRLPRL